MAIKIFFGTKFDTFNYNEDKFLTQVHGNRVVVVTDPTQDTLSEEADALVTTLSNIKLCIKTADCVPILLESRDVIGAIHAGWRGAFSCIVQNTIDVMQQMGASDIKAHIGPCIRRESYEVDQAFYEKFIESNNLNNLFFDKIANGKYLFDLPGYCHNILINNGVEDIRDAEIDTYTNTDKFFSYRYSSKNSTPLVLSERQISYIVKK